MKIVDQENIYWCKAAASMQEPWVHPGGRSLEMEAATPSILALEESRGWGLVEAKPTGLRVSGYDRRLHLPHLTSILSPMVSFLDYNDFLSLNTQLNISLSKKKL